VKIGLVDIEIIDLTEIFKNIFKQLQKHKPSSSEWAENEIVRVLVQTDKSRKALFVFTVYV